MISIITAVVLSAISGLVGGCVGGLVAWGGIRVRLQHLEEKTKRLSDSVVYQDVCEVVRQANEQQHKAVMDRLENIQREVMGLGRTKT